MELENEGDLFHQRPQTKQHSFQPEGALVLTLMLCILLAAAAAMFTLVAWGVFQIRSGAAVSQGLSRVRAGINGFAVAAGACILSVAITTGSTGSAVLALIFLTPSLICAVRGTAWLSHELEEQLVEAAFKRMTDQAGI